MDMQKIRNILRLREWWSRTDERNDHQWTDTPDLGTRGFAITLNQIAAIYSLIIPPLSRNMCHAISVHDIYKYVVFILYV